MLNYGTVNQFLYEIWHKLVELFEAKTILIVVYDIVFISKNKYVYKTCILCTSTYIIASHIYVHTADTNQTIYK